MIRIPRVLLVLVVAALLVLIAVPMAGARTLSAPSVHPADGSWLGAALRWAEGFVGLNPAALHHGHMGSQIPPNQKDDPQAYQPQGGGCVTPDGHTKPICL